MRLKNIPFKKSLKDELSSAKKSKDFKDLHLKNPGPTTKEPVKDIPIEETKELIANLRRIWGSNPNTSKKTTPKKK